MKTLENFRSKQTELKTIKGGIGKPVFENPFENVCGFTGTGKVIHCYPTVPPMSQR